MNKSLVALKRLAYTVEVAIQLFRNRLENPKHDFWCKIPNKKSILKSGSGNIPAAVEEKDFVYQLRLRNGRSRGRVSLARELRH